MNARGLSDARKIPDEVMNYLRCLAVRAVEEQGHSPELIAAMFGISRSRLYEWLRRDWAHGEAALDTRTAPGAPQVITWGMNEGLRKTVLESTPVDHGNHPVLWTRKILAELLEKRFGIHGVESTVGLHLPAHRPATHQKQTRPEATPRRLDAALRALQAFPERVRSFFQLPDTQYAAIPESALTPCPVIN